MSDFLSQLIERSVTPMAGVRPRPAAGFEPISMPSWSPDANPAAEIDTDATPDTVSREARPASRPEGMTPWMAISPGPMDRGNERSIEPGPVRTDASGSPPVAREPSPIEPVATPVPESTRTRRDPAPPPLRPVPADPPRVREEPVSAHPAPREVPSRPGSRAPTELVVGRTRAADADGEASQTGEQTLPSMIRRMITQPVHRERSRGEIGALPADESADRTSTKMEPSAHGRRPVAESRGGRELAPGTPRLDPNRREALRPRPDLTVSASEPITPRPTTVSVRIGRIEVRATRSEPPAVPAPAKRAPRPHVMSLEEYLGQRARSSG